MKHAKDNDKAIFCHKLSIKSLLWQVELLAERIDSLAAVKYELNAGIGSVHDVDISENDSYHRFIISLQVQCGKVTPSDAGLPFLVVVHRDDLIKTIIPSEIELIVLGILLFGCRGFLGLPS